MYGKFFSKFFVFYEESEVEFISFLRVDNTTIQLPSGLNFSIQQNNLSIKMEIPGEEKLTVTNLDNESHIFAYRFQAILPKKDNIDLVPDSRKLTNGTYNIYFSSSEMDEIRTYKRNEDNIVDLIYYPKIVDTNKSIDFEIVYNNEYNAYPVYYECIYNDSQIRGTNVLNFSFDRTVNRVLQAIAYFDFELPFVIINNTNEGYLIPISFLPSGTYKFCLLKSDYDNHNLNIIDPPPIKIENNTLEKEKYYKTTDNSMKLIYDIEFPSNVLYSFNYYFDDNEDDKFTEYIYGTNDTEHIERNIDLPSSFTSSDHKLHYFFNATGLTTETFENSFSLIYHKPTIHLLTDNDRSNLPIYIRSVNDTIRIRVKIEDDDLNDNVTSIASIESTSICQTISKIAPYSNEFQIVPSFDELNEGIIFVTIYAVDEHGNNASKNESFYFEYKYNKPEIEFQSESNISRIGNFIRIKCRVRYYRKGGVLKIETNITNDDFISTNVKEYFIEDDLFNDINIDIPINQFYEGNYSISICVSNEHDEISHFMTSKFTLDDIPTLEDLPEIKKFKHYNKFTPFIFSSISK